MPFPTLKKQLYSPLATGWSCTLLRSHGIGYGPDSAGRTYVIIIIIKPCALARLMILQVPTLFSQQDSVFAIAHDMFAVFTGSA